MHLKIIFAFCFLYSGWVQSQSLLTLDEAITVALEENLSISIAQLGREAAAMNVYRSNAGFGPLINWNANVGATGNNVQQRFLDGREVDRWGRSYSPGTNINLNWTLYDGGRMQTVFERLQQLSEVSNIQTQLAVQTLVEQVMQTYFEIIRLSATVDYLNTIISYYEDRLAITEERWNVGKGSKLDFLQSKTDLNAQLSLKSTTVNDLKNVKIQMNNLLHRDLQIDFLTEEDVALYDETYDLKALQSEALNANRDLILATKVHQLSLLEEVELKAGRKPQVALNSTLGYTYNNTNAGFLLSNRSGFINAAVSATWNIFDGHNRERQIAISRIESERLLQQRDLVEEQVVAEITTAFNQYNADLEIQALEEQNLVVVEENLQISLEKFKLGASTILELNEAQRSYDDSINRLVNAQNNVRLSELDLLRLTGKLIR